MTFFKGPILENAGRKWFAVSCDAFRFRNAVAGEASFVHPVDCQQPNGFARHAVFDCGGIGSQLWKIGCETGVRVRARAGFVVDDGITLQPFC